MKDIKIGLIWAAAILLLALGNVYGLVDDETAQTMFVIMPALAVVSFGGRSCLVRRRGAGA